MSRKNCVFQPHGTSGRVGNVKRKTTLRQRSRRCWGKQSRCVWAFDQIDKAQEEKARGHTSAKGTWIRDSEPALRASGLYRTRGYVKMLTSRRR